MAYYHVANLVTETKRNKNKMPWGCETLKITAVRIWHQVSCRACAEVSADLEVFRRPAQRFQQLQHLTILIFNLIVFWVRLHNCKCFQKHVKMILLSLRAHCKAAVGTGSIWKDLEALVRATAVCGRFECGFLTDLHFTDVNKRILLLQASYLQPTS